MDCAQGLRVFFQCDQASYVKANYLLLTTRLVQAPTLTTLQITDGRQGRVEALKGRGRSYQLTTKEARGCLISLLVCTYIYSCYINLHAYVYFLCFGTFLVNSMHALVLFESGTSQSFVSLSFKRSFDVALGVLDFLLHIFITYRCKVSTTSVFFDCVLEIFGVHFPIELSPIPMGNVCVIVDMDWLSWFRALTDCERHLVVIRTPSGVEITIYGKCTRIGSTLCSVVRARRYLQQVFARYLAYVFDFREDKKNLISDVPVV